MNKKGNIKQHVKFSYRKVKWVSGSRYIPDKYYQKDYSEIKKNIEEIKNISEKKDEIIKDKNLYFIISFTENINSTNIIRLIDSFNLWKLIKIINLNTAKFSINKGLYQNFLALLQRKKNYFANVRGVTLNDVFSEEVKKDIKNVEVNRLNVIVEFSSSLPLDESSLRNKLHQYLEKTKGGKLKTCKKIGYNILCTLNVKKDEINELASKIEGINNIQKEQKPFLNNFTLQGIEERTTRHHKAKLTQMPVSSTNDININDFPTVGILDSGISNPNGKIKKSLITSTYDFEYGEKGHCKDECGHGTFVSGRVIHGGNISDNSLKCKVAISKIFKDHNTLVKCDLSLLGMIEKTIEIFQKNVKVYNMSFCMGGPDPILSKRLDFIANEKNMLFVNSSGNFDLNEIKYYLNNGNDYPKYLTELNVYPPADCFNILTVGSHTHKSSNLCPANAPSPFTRCISFNNRTKPEILCEGGNLSVEYDAIAGKIKNLKTDGLTVWSYSHEQGMDFADGIGTSYAAPIAASIAARLFKKYNKSSINLIKSLLINSCSLLQDQTGELFEQNYQGFGVPNDYFALNSSKSRVTLFSEAEFDLKDKDRYAHEYKFHVPDDVSRIIITVIFTNPIEEHLPPSQLAVGLKYAVHKAGVNSKTKSKPSMDMTRKNDNVIHCLYDVKRGGRGIWKLKLKPKIFFPMNTHFLNYALVITQIAKGSTNIYNEIIENLKL